MVRKAESLDRWKVSHTLMIKVEKFHDCQRVILKPVEKYHLSPSIMGQIQFVGEVADVRKALVENILLIFIDQLL